MRKHHKKALGLAGLSAVVAMTVVAANIPTPAGAVSSVSDTITVTVLDDRPAAAIANISEGLIFSKDTVSAKIDYVNLEELTVTLNYVGPSNISVFGANPTIADGQSHQFNFDYDHRTGTVYVDLDLDQYGDYMVSLNGRGFGIPVENFVTFRYNAVSIDDLPTDTDSEGNIIGDGLPTNEVTGDPIITIPTLSQEVDHVEIEVKDKDGNPVKGKDGKPIVVIAPSTGGDISVPFTENDLPEGDYIVTVTAKDKDGDNVGDPINIIYHYTPIAKGNDITTDKETGNPVINVPTPGEGNHFVIDVYDKDGNPIITGLESTGGPLTLPFTDKDVKEGDYIIVMTEYDASGNKVGSANRVSYSYVPLVPDTGSLLQQLNLSRADYLTSGLVIFGLATITAGAIFVKKKNHSRNRSRRSRR